MKGAWALALALMAQSMGHIASSETVRSTRPVFEDPQRRESAELKHQKENIAVSDKYVPRMNSGGLFSDRFRDDRCEDKWSEFYDRESTTITVAFGNAGITGAPRDLEQSNLEYSDLAKLRAFREMAMTPCDCFECSEGGQCLFKQPAPAKDFERCLKIRYGDYQTYQNYLSYGQHNWNQYRSEDQLCGFQPDQQDESVLVKSVEVAGVKRTVRLQTLSATAEYDPFEILEGRHSGSLVSKDREGEHRKQTREKFMQALCSSRAVFYLGHARYGCGPDFELSRRTPSGAVNSKLYKAKAAKADSDCGIHEMQDRLKQCQASASGKSDSSRAPDSTSRPTKILGLMACDAVDHFGDKLRAASPQTAQFFSPTPVNPERGFFQMRNAVEAILAGRCEREFSAQTVTPPGFQGVSLSTEGSAACSFDASLVAFFGTAPKSRADWRARARAHEAMQCE